MTTKTIEQPKPKRPYHGPHFTSRWSSREGRWVMRMNDAGRAAFEEAMKQFDGCPERILIARFKPLYLRAMRHSDRDGVHQAALCGLLDGVRCWKPGKDGGRDTKLNTLMMFHVANKVDRFLKGERGDDVPFELNLSAAVNREDDEEWLPASELPDTRAESPDEGAMAAESREVLGRLLAVLPARERDIIRLRHLEGRTLNQVAAELRLTRERVRQLGEAAMAKMEAAAHRQAQPDNLPLPYAITAYLNRVGWAKPETIARAVGRPAAEIHRALVAGARAGKRFQNRGHRRLMRTLWAVAGETREPKPYGCGTSVCEIRRRMNARPKPENRLERDRKFRQRVIDALTAKPGQTMSELATSLKLPKSSIENLLRKGVRNGRPLFRRENVSARFSRKPVVWFVADGQQAPSR
jgi:RNA polymerase sigma factor (sigma-70 family)